MIIIIIIIIIISCFTDEFANGKNTEIPFMFCLYTSLLQYVVSHSQTVILNHFLFDCNLMTLLKLSFVSMPAL